MAIHSIQYIYMGPTNKNKYLIFGCLINLLILQAEAFCGETTFLSATEGRLVVLQPVMAEIKEPLTIFWIHEDATEIAAIRCLNGTVEIQNNENNKKCYVSDDGSLKINNFKMEDQGVYIVIIKRVDQLDCTHTYNVTMSEKSPCGKFIAVSGREEEEITLPLYTSVEQIKIIYWFSPRGDLLAKTKPGGYMQAQSNYDRRLQTLVDGSLSIMKLSLKDQGTYVANVHMYSGKSCSQIYNVTITGGIPESPKIKKVYVYSREEQNVTLLLPQHLKDQVEDIFWINDDAIHFATTFINGSLHVLDSRYQGRLQSSSDGSLIIINLRIEDRGQYSADIHLMNKELYTEIYRVGVYRKQYYLSLGMRNVSATEGEDLILQNNLKKIKAIDWLTQQWIRFAVTNLDGHICIFDQNYSGRLSSLDDGSIILKAVTKKDEGTYRAYVFSHNGTILVQEYYARVYDNPKIVHALTAVATVLLIIISALLVYLWCMRRKRTIMKMTMMIKKPVKEKHKTLTIIERTDFEEVHYRVEKQSVEESSNVTDFGEIHYRVEKQSVEESSNTLTIIERTDFGEIHHCVFKMQSEQDIYYRTDFGEVYPCFFKMQSEQDIYYTKEADIEDAVCKLKGDPEVT